jgi:hypothetical protein
MEDCLNEPQLIILVASIEERLEQSKILLNELTRQKCTLHPAKWSNISIITILDNKEISIGKKRQRLLELAAEKRSASSALYLEDSTNQYVVFFDDDDWPSENYVERIYRAISLLPDCVGITVNMTTNGGRPQRCCHSLKYKEWAEHVDGFDYVRNVTHFNPVRLDLALQVGFEDVRFGEDKIYSDKLTALCTREEFLDAPLFEYRYNDTIPFEQKYGIQK